jgi:glyoxylase-like metal-dependent hydrolase (beta-lactamase superfamily II)
MAVTSQAITELGAGVTHFQAVTWRCNCIVVTEGSEALVIDACWTPSEIGRICRHVAGLSTHLLITHADPDHACGIGYMPEATVVMGERSALRLEDGSAQRELRSEAGRWGLDTSAALRVDRIVEAGTEATLGSLHVATVEARGHSSDGLAYLLRERGIFAVGDYLSAAMCPLIWSSVSDARRTTERLLATLDQHDIELVVPGHGPLLTVADARRIGEQDLAYLDAVNDAADAAHRGGATIRDWLVAVHRVPPPRPTDDDLDIFCPRLLSAAATFRDRGVADDMPWQLSL